MINWYSLVTLNDFTFQRITQKTLHRPMLQQHISRIPHLTKDINNKFPDKLIPIINQSFRNNFPLLLKQSLNRSTNQREIEKLRDRRSITYFEYNLQYWMFPVRWSRKSSFSQDSLLKEVLKNSKQWVIWSFLRRVCTLRFVSDNFKKLKVNYYFMPLSEYLRYCF